MSGLAKRVLQPNSRDGGRVRARKGRFQSVEAKKCQMGRLVHLVGSHTSWVLPRAVRRWS
ncbi:hypothetical protein STVIR_8502 [Streptomyces viridochromogenes Tue57]|uniref:Uncharacterized protein n=1 Tax=Streptomyces viridochromogenes Tue57 TaxID=1160705 RepID=L8P2Z0_STRVR|nr:hypothetical protein STVIR_8502 [Streptomyces viridochromogenes Tue57]